MAAIIRVKDTNGNIFDIPAIKGMSAYEYALAAGYQGTEKEFTRKMSENIIGRMDNITVFASNWIGTNNIFKQEVSLSNITEKSKIDIQLTPDQYLALQENEVSFIAANDGGIVTVYAINAAPTIDYNLQVVITELDVV